MSQNFRTSSSDIDLKISNLRFYRVIQNEKNCLSFTKHFRNGSHSILLESLERRVSVIVTQTFLKVKKFTFVFFAVERSEAAS